MHNPIRAKWYIVFHIPFDMWICVCFRWSRSISFFFLSRELFHVICRRIYLICVYPLWANIINFLFSILTQNSFVSPLLSIVEIFLLGNKKKRFMPLNTDMSLHQRKPVEIIFFYGIRIDFMYDASHVAIHICIMQRTRVHTKDIPFESPGSHCRDERELNPCLRDIFNLTSSCE